MSWWKKIWRRRPAMADESGTIVFSLPHNLELASKLSPATLVILAGEDEGMRLVLPRQAVYIGRRADCTITINHPTVSRLHARLEPTERGWLVADLGSANGTLVNGKRIVEKQLRAGDRIKIGPWEAEFTIQGEHV